MNDVLHFLCGVLGGMYLCYFVLKWALFHGLMMFAEWESRQEAEEVEYGD